ncbi:MAG: nitroreductase family protein [Paludibacteraceae bacterium]|nr:nitroreductase family protein [Paludibacteraceae bacterium]
MKKIFLFALVGTVLMACQKQETTNSTTMKQDNVIENIRTRVSVRQFTGEKISDEQIQTLLQCAMSAPSALNHQPWAFIVITEDSLLAQLGQAFPYSRCDQHPACAIIPCGDLTKAIEGSEGFWINDVSAATENILLAAHAMGLGAVWTGLHPNMERATAAQQLLGLPEHIIPMCIVPVGVPAEQPEVKDKWKTDNIHYNRW